MAWGLATVPIEFRPIDDADEGIRGAVVTVAVLQVDQHDLAGVSRQLAPIGGTLADVITSLRVDDIVAVGGVADEGDFPRMRFQGGLTNDRSIHRPTTPVVAVAEAGDTELVEPLREVSEAVVVEDVGFEVEVDVGHEVLLSSVRPKNAVMRVRASSE